MSGPWEDYAAPASSAPWEDYGGTPAPAKAAPARKSTVDYGLSDLIASKMTLGLADKAAAAGQALGHSVGDLVHGKSTSLGDNYHTAIGDVDAAKAKYQDDHPALDWGTLPLNLYAPGKAAGAVVDAVRAGGKGLFGAGVKSGTKAGLVAGVGQSRGDYGDQAGQIAATTGASALTAGVASRYVPTALAAAANYGRPAIRKVAQVVAPRSELATSAADNGLQNAPPTARAAQSYIAARLAADGTDPAALAAQMAAAKARGVPFAPMDSGPNMQRAAAAIGRKSGPGSKIVTDTVAARQLNQGERVQGAITRDLGPTASVRQASEDLMAQAKTTAGPLYDEAYAQPPISAPILDDLLSRPAGRSAVNRAATIAANEGRNPAALGFRQAADGSYEVHPAPVEALDKLDLARQEYDKIAQIHAQAQRSPAHSRDLAMGQIQPLLDAAAQRLDVAHKALAVAPQGGSAVQVKSYTPQTLDYVKRGLDDIVESHRDPVTGRLVLDEAGRAINGVRAKLVKHLRDNNPAYSKALDAYAGPARMASALAKGSKVLGKSADDITAYMRDMTPAELEQFRLGARSALSNSVGDKVDAADRVRALIGTDNKRKALQKVFGGTEGLDNFMATLGHEATTSRTYQRITGNSLTAENALDDADLSGVAHKASAALHLAKGNPIPAMAQVWNHVSDKFGGEAGQKMRAQVAGLITQSDPEVVRQFMAAATKQNARQVVGRKAVPVIGAAAGRASGGLLSGR